MGGVATLALATALISAAAACRGPDSVAVIVPDSTQASTVSECSRAPSAWIWCDDFETDRLAHYFEYTDDGGSFARRPDVGLDGSAGMRAHFEKGQVSAGSLKLAFGVTPSSYFDPVDDGTTKYREIYWRFYLRYQDGWIGGGGYKVTRAIAFASAHWAEAMMAYVWSDGTDDQYLVLDPASGTDETGNLRSTKYNDNANERWLGLVRGRTPIFDANHVGQWYCVEIHVRLNHAGTNDGVFEYWINGNLEARTSDLNWLGAYDAYGINAIFLENYWNGGSPRSQDRFFDNFVVSTERIGCGPGSP